MASSVYDDDSSVQSYDSSILEEYELYNVKRIRNKQNENTDKNINVVHKLLNRQMYGRTNNHKTKTEPIFKSIHPKCKIRFDDLLISSELNFREHIFLGFTICGRYFITLKEQIMELSFIIYTKEYDLFIWSFNPFGNQLKVISTHRIFKLLKGPELDQIMCLQFPSDPHKLYCYGVGDRLFNPPMAYLTILTLPSEDNCRICKEDLRQIDDSLAQGWCLTHGFMQHYMFTMSQPVPQFSPYISLSFPDHIVINTGIYIHILNTSTYKPNPQTVPTFFHLLKEEKQCNFADNASEISEGSFGANSIVEAILEDFSEYDLESNDCMKPFHELNISCEPLNVTGKSYHNALVQNIVDPRLKRLQSKEGLFSIPQSSALQEKPTIDRKIAEKAYEFTDEIEKCEKLSSFRKKRLADKKYEFSEDNSENIVPFNSLRRERRFLYKSRSIKSPEFGLFLSPRSPGIRSPMQSPNSRNGQFSPAATRIYCPGLRNSPHHSKSPISPRDSARKINVYSPSIDSDCSDYDSKLVLRQISSNFPITNLTDHRIQQPFGLLIVDSKRDETSKWIKKVVRRYSSVDFENGSIVSGQSRDDYNIPIEVPLIVQKLNDQQLDIIPEFKADKVMETQLIVTQRSFDCEQFVQRRAQKLCVEHKLEFLHCEDYEISIEHICPLEGQIICKSVIKIVAMKLYEPNPNRKPLTYVASCVFTWNIETDVFELIEPPEHSRLQPFTANTSPTMEVHIPQINTREIHVMEMNYNASKIYLRDYNNQYEVFLDPTTHDSETQIDSLSMSSDSEVTLL